MPNHLHDKIEHFIIHLVAALLTVSTFFAAFLAYGVYEGGKPGYSDLVSKPKAASGTSYWTQRDWDGGISSQTYVINWESPGTWNYYSSASNVTAGTNVWSNATGGELVSSIFDAGTTYRIGHLSYTSINDAPSVYVRGANTVDEVNSASWQLHNYNNPPCIANYRYIQYKVVFPSDNSGIDDVVLWTNTVSIYGTVTDTNTGAKISGASVTANGITVTTALQRKNLISQVQAGGGLGPGDYSIGWVYKTSDPTSYSVTATKTGYQSQTKTVTINPATCDFWKTADFALSPISGSSTPTSTGQSTSTTTSTKSVNLTTTQQIKLPAVFTSAGSTTTDLSRIADNKKVENFTLDIPGKNKIVFKEALDISSEATINALKELDKYVKMGTIGVIELDSKALSALNKKATLTMSGLKYVAAPTVLVDGKTAPQGLVSNLIYNKTSGTLAFDVAHFTRYEAAAKFELLAPVSTSVSNPNTIIKVRISDPEAVVTGTFNEVNLAKITPDPKTGEFTLEKLVFKEGENTLKLSAQSKLGKVEPLNVTFFYGAQKTVTKTAKPDYRALIIVLFVALAFAILLGYLIYRRKKFHSKLVSGGEKQASEQTQPEGEK